MKYVKRIGALTAVALLSMAACSPSTGAGGTDENGSATSGDDVILNVWSWQAQRTDVWDEIFDVFEEANPGVKVNFDGFQASEYNQILTTALSGNDGPDVAMLRTYGLLQNWVNADQIVAIDDLVPGLEEKIDPSVLAGARGQEDGLIYGVPFASQTLQVLYNKTLFDEHGLSEPETWEQFISLNDELLELGITPLAVGAQEAWVLPMFADIFGAATYGGKQFEEAVLSGEKDFTDPDFVESLRVVADMKEYLDPSAVGIDTTGAELQFTTGQAAQYSAGSFDLINVESAAPEMEVGVYQVPPPLNAVLDHPVTPGYADGSFGINSKSENQEEATALLNWMASQEFGQLISDKLATFSPISGVTYENPVMQEMWDMFEENPASYLLLVNFRYGDPTGTDVLGVELQKVLLGESTPEEAAQALQDGVSVWFTP